MISHLSLLSCLRWTDKIDIVIFQRFKNGEMNWDIFTYFETTAKTRLLSQCVSVLYVYLATIVYIGSNWMIPLSLTWLLSVLIIFSRLAWNVLSTEFFCLPAITPQPTEHNRTISQKLYGFDHAVQCSCRVTRHLIKPCINFRNIISMNIHVYIKRNWFSLMESLEND